MSSSKTDPEKSERRRIRELEEQLEDEQHAHRKTKFTLRDVEEQLEEMSSGKDSNDSGKIQENHLLKSLRDEIVVLKNELRGKDEKIGVLERQRNNPEEMKKLIDLERENHSLRMEMSTMKKANEENMELMKTVNIEKAELKYELERQSEKVTDAENKWNRMRIEKENLEEELQRLKQTLEENTEKIGDYKNDIQVLMELNKELMETLKSEQSEKEELETKLEEQWDEMKNNLTRLQEYSEEVLCLHNSKASTLYCCREWISKYSVMIYRLILVLKETNSKNNEEEVRELEEDRKKADDENEWWEEYSSAGLFLYQAFQSMHIIRVGGLNSKEILNSSQSRLNEGKRKFEKSAEKVRRGMEEKEWWIKKELDSNHFDTWQQLLTEASERINKS